MARQRRIARPKAPNMAPTAMKTVPSGALECCMKGASLVGGTVGAGYVGIAVTLVKVGSPVRPASVFPSEMDVIVDWISSVVVVEDSDTDVEVVLSASLVVSG